MVDLREQTYTADVPQVALVQGQDLRYPAVGSCITVTYARVGPPAPYLVGVHLGEFNSSMGMITIFQIELALHRMNVLLETREHYITRRRPHSIFVIGAIGSWPLAQMTRVRNLVNANQRRKGTGVFFFDLWTMPRTPNATDITFQYQAPYRIIMEGDHRERIGDTWPTVWHLTHVRRTGAWYPPGAANV